MRILDRYILKSVLAVFLTCIFIFLFLYITMDILSFLEEMLKKQVNFLVLVYYYLCYIPIMFVQVAPFACLLSTLYTFGKLNRNNEIIAMRSAGLSIFQISKTVIIFSLVVSLFVFWVNDRLVPRSTLMTKKILEQIEESKKKGAEKKQEVINNLTMYGLKNRLYFINKFYPVTGNMEGIIILEHDQKQNITKKIVANKGFYEENLWKFSQCITYNFDSRGQIVQEPQYLEEEIMLIPETPQDFLNQRQRPEVMDIRQLQDYIWRLSKSGATTVIRNARLELYQRFTSPFTSIIIVLLGIPFSLLARKRATGLSSIGITIMVGVLYYILEAISIALGRGGVIAPILAVSVSPLIGIVFASRLIRNLP